jgi:hypothetical protein
VKIVFRYHKEPTNNFLGTDGSSDAITLFDTGIVRYEHYLFRCAEPFKTKDFGPFEELVTIVQSIIDEYAFEIESFPDFINNDCFDGSWKHFQLRQKKITIDNMSYSSEEDIQTIRLLHDGEDELDRMLLATRQTNTMVVIYSKIASAFFEHCVDKNTTNQSTTISPKTQDKF